jgi:hypothetical protein
MAWHFQVLFEKAPFPACFDAHDADDDGDIDVDDGFFIGDFLFLLGPPIPEPFPIAGPDPTPDDLECQIGA